MTATRLAPAAVLLSAVAARADAADGPPYYGHMWEGGWGLGFGIFNMGFMLLFWGAIIVLAIAAFRWLDSARTQPPGGGDALDILRSRLARGEIDATEFAERKAALEK